MKTIKTHIIIFLLLLVQFSFAQQISNIHFEQAGKQIHIYYDLAGDENYTVEVFCSTDNGNKWGEPLKYASGNVGENQTAGKGKGIVWDVLAERNKLTGEISFKIVATLPEKNIKLAGFSQKSGTFIDDRDGQKYKWVKIGEQIWMAQNLNIGLNIKGSEMQTNNKVIEKYCYDNNESNCDEYGGLYQWDEMMQYVNDEGTQGICPDGWHIPSDEEWKELELSIGMSQSEVDNGNVTTSIGNSGGKLKSNHGWYENGNGSDLFEFKALPGGYRSIKYGGKFDFLEWAGYWWTSSESEDCLLGAWDRSLDCFNNGLSRDRFCYYGAKDRGMSVRCLRD